MALMMIPVVTGTGRRTQIDSDDYGRLVLLPRACEGIDPRIWTLDLYPQPQRDPVTPAPI